MDGMLKESLGKTLDRDFLFTMFIINATPL